MEIHADHPVCAGLADRGCGGGDPGLEESAMILFLDFDGTTHPFGCNSKDDFSCLPRIERVLREFPKVRVVISSWWRDGATLEQLRSYFSHDMCERVIDVTPIEKALPYGSDSGIIVGAMERGEEVALWMKLNNYQGPWVALDDDARGFPEGCPQFILCDSYVGVDAKIEEELRHYLSHHEKSHY